MNQNNLSPLSSLSYLIVDDEQKSQTILKTLVQKTIGSHQIEVIAKNDHFMQDVKELSFQPDVILLDLMMEPYSGFDLLEMLRSDPTYKQTIIIAITAQAMTHDVARMKKVGFNGLISKPIVRHIFPDLIQRIIAGEEVWYVA